MNTKLHAVTDTAGRPIQFVITAGHASDYKGAAALSDRLPKAELLVADRRYRLFFLHRQQVVVPRPRTVIAFRLAGFEAAIIKLSS